MRKVAGLDISFEKTAVCVLDRDGQLVWCQDLPLPAWRRQPSATSALSQNGGKRTFVE